MIKYISIFNIILVGISLLDQYDNIAFYIMLLWIGVLFQDITIQKQKEIINKLTKGN